MVVGKRISMANNNVPNHDFAPAWLKIPTQDPALKLSSGDANHFSAGSHNSRKEEIFNSDSVKPEFLSSNPRKKFHIYPSRHSIDVDDSKFYFHNNSHQSFYSKRDPTYLKNNVRLNNSHYGSVPALHQRPHSRHDFRSNDVSHFNSSHSKGYTNNGDLNNVSSFHGPPRTRSQSRHPASDSTQKSKDSFSDTKNEPEDFNNQFPSLGNVSPKDNENEQRSSSINGGVWDNAHLYKGNHTKKRMQLVQKPVKCEGGEKQTSYPGKFVNGSPKLNPHAAIVNQANKTSSQNQASSSVYRALVPFKDSAGNAKVMSPPAIVQNNTSKELRFASNSSNHMEIFVKNPKHLSNKKSEFLKKLRNEGNSNESNDENMDKAYYREVDENHSQGHHEESLVNGIEIHKLQLTNSNSDGSILSKSMEAEQRLLREMGWKDEGSDDEDTYAPLTEAELQEFRDLSRKKAEQRPSQHTIWSPKKIISPFVANAVVSPVADNDSSWSSSSSDSE
ncbi:Vasculin-like protein 1 [Nymphon striatum]|nr:Vasculin-like protein 1 [Nymphon striatum]